MANQRRSQRLGLLATLFLLAGSASAVSLANLQLISAPEVPIECMTAYSLELVGCDFLTENPGSRCTGRCRNSLQNTQAAVQASCGTVQSAPGTILNAAQSGRLVEAVCGAGPGNGNGRGPPPGQAPPNDEPQQNPDIPPVMTVKPGRRPGESLVTAPLPTPVVGLNDGNGNNAPLPLPTNSITITTAIQPSIPANAGGGASNPRPTSNVPNIPVNGGSGPFESGRGVSAAPHMSHAASILYTFVAGTLLVLLF